MKGGTLLFSREESNHAHFKKRLEALGFCDVTVTAEEKDALYSRIYNLKPALVMMGARFYQCATPYLMGEIKRNFPKLKLAALCIGEFPADLAMYFILYGVQSYVTSFDGLDQFYTGLDEISKGREFISPEVVRRMDLRTFYPGLTGVITDRQREVIRLVCNGFTEIEIADTLHISRSTVNTHKRDIFGILNVRNENELIRAALNLEIVHLNEMVFFPKGFELKPKPNNKAMKRGSK